MKTTILALALFAGIATASPVLNNNIEALDIQDPTDSPTTLLVDLSGFNSWDEQGNALNEILTLGFPSQFQLTGISWDVTIEALGVSWFSELNIHLSNTDGSGSYTLVPGIGVDFPGTMRFTGFVDLVALGQDFSTNNDNLFNIEFFESFVDNPGDIDAFFHAGSTLTLHLKKVPAPGSMALLGFGALAATRRRRAV